MIPFIEQTKNILYRIVTLNIAGNYPLGGIMASIASFPLIILGRMLYIFSIDLFYNSLISFTILFVGSIHIVLQSLPAEKQNTIVINRLVGLLIGYYYIPMQIKFIILSLMVFHMIRNVTSQIVVSRWNIDLEAINGLVGVFSLDIISGIITNICMHILRILLA
jgi:phosphatidylglycerophosphatase A